MQWSQNLCRICGQISETCHVIYNKEFPTSLENKIKKCLNLNLYKGDYKPKQICNNCVVKLNEFSEFMDLCYTTNQKFESIYFNSQSWHNKNYDYPLTQKQSVIVSNKQVPDNLDFELYKNTGIVLENLNITNCQLNDADILDLVGDGDCNNLEYCRNHTADTKPRGHYTVLRCSNIAPELAANNGKNDKVCYIKYDTQEQVKSKKKTVTVDSVQDSLMPPPKRNSSREKVRKTYPCPHCDRTFVRRGSLNSHVANHTNMRPYKCEDCSKSFGVKSDLTTHKKVHSDQHQCSYCYKKFSVPSKLKRHVRIHTNEKPYVCNFPNCHKAFSDKRNLEGHKLIHMSEKKYSCTVCMKLFKTLTRLKQHSKCHTCGIMYTCDLCAKKYKYKSNLISHIKKHNNICPYCKVDCESNTLLTQHIKICRARTWHNAK